MPNQIGTKNRFYLPALALVVILSILIALLTHKSDNSSNTAKVSPPQAHLERASIGGKQLLVETAATPQAQEKGLSGRQNLPTNQGLLFPQDGPNYAGIWMRDMLFSIDVIWLDQDKRVVDFRGNLSPGSFPQVFYSKSKASSILELSAGFIKANRIEMGDLLRLSQ